jgi:flagellum-specific peptidoglycan hydrolase FlgJ
MYSSYTYDNMKVFIDKYGKDIVSAIKGTGLFFTAVAAQKSYESDYGNSELASKYNNFGGVKNFGGLSGAGVVNLDTAEKINGKRVIKKQPFATYPNPKSAFESYVRILKDPTKKYTSNGVFTAIDPIDQIKRMVQAGYSTENINTYLNAVKGRIEAARDYSKLGKIA